MEPHPTLRRPRRRGRTIALVGLGMLLSIAAAAAYVYYSVLPAALAPRLVQVLEARLGPGNRVTVGDTHLITASGRIELQAEKLGITGPDGREVAFAPDARVELDRSALLRGEVAIASLQLDQPRLVLRSPPEARNAAPLAQAPQAPVSAANRDLLAHIVGTLDRLTAPGGAAAALEEVRVSSAVLVLDRGAADAPAQLDRLSVRLKRGAANGFAITVSSEGSVDRWSATLTSTAPSTEGRVFDLGLDNVSLATTARLGGLDPAPDYDATVSGHVSIRLDGNAVFQAGEARLDLARLTFALPGPKKTPLVFDRAQLRGRWDGETRSIKLDPSPVAAAGGGVTLVGEARAPAPGSADPWQIRLQGLQAEVPGAAGDPPLRLDAVNIRAAFSPQKSMLELLEGHIVGPTVNVAMSGSLTFGDSSPAIALGIAAAPLSVSAMKRLWPFFLAEPVREWVLANVLAGTVSGFSMMTDIKQGVLAAQKPFEPLPDKAVYLEASFTDGALVPAPGLPPIIGASGRYRASGHRVELVVDSGRLEAAPGQMVALRGRFEVPDAGPRFPPARVQLQLDGPLAGAAQLFATGALGPNPLPPGIDPASVRGAFSVQSQVDLTLGPPGEVPPLEVKVDGTLKEVSIDKFVAGKALEAGEFRLVRDRTGASLVGEAKLGGATTQIDLRDEGPSGRREVLASATLDTSARIKLGLPGGNAIKGPIAVKVKAPLIEGPIEVQADIAGADLDGLVPGLAKRAGTPGKLAFSMLKTPEAISLRDIAIDSGPASIRGNVELDGSGALVSAKLGTYRLSPGDDVRVSVEKSKSLTKVALAGNSIDLRPLMADIVAGDTGDNTAPDLDLDVTVDSATGHNGEKASALKLSLSRRSGVLKTLELKSDRFGSGRVEVRPLADGSGYVFTGDDAGSFLRFLDVYSKAYGGKFALRVSASSRMDGRLEVEGFEIRGERALASVTSNDKAWVDQRGGVRETTRSNGPHTVTFTKLKMNFSRSGGRLSLDDVVVWGPQIGLSVEGVLDFSGDRVAVTGTFVPAYSLNNLFSKLPVIGFFLGGGNDQGLLGVTFRVTGTLRNPTLTINPMSAVAPGFLRKLFEFRQVEGATTAESTGRTNVSPR